MVVTTLYNGVYLRDKVIIWAEYDPKITGGWCGGDVISKDINGKGGIKAFARWHCLPMTKNSVLSGFNFCFCTVNPQNVWKYQDINNDESNKMIICGD